jgi:hypothetical protein
VKTFTPGGGEGSLRFYYEINSCFYQFYFTPPGCTYSNKNKTGSFAKAKNQSHKKTASFSYETASFLLRICRWDGIL